MFLFDAGNNNCCDDCENCADDAPLFEAPIIPVLNEAQLQGIPELWGGVRLFNEVLGLF